MASLKKKDDCPSESPETFSGTLNEKNDDTIHRPSDYAVYDASPVELYVILDATGHIAI